MIERKIDRRSAPALRLIEGSAVRAEAREAWGAIRVLTGRGHLAVVAERPDLALHAFGQIRSIADRKLRQLGDTDDAA